MTEPVATPPPSTTEKPASASHRDLGHRAARGASTMVVGQAVRILLQLVSVVILARLLDPTDYGLFAIALAVAGLGEILRDFGLSTAAVQAPTLSVQQRDQLFWINTGIGGALAVVIAASSPLFALIFDLPELTGLMIVMSATFLVNGMTAQYRADLNRRLRFSALVSSEIVAQFLGILGAVAVALAGGGYWALAAQQLVVVVSTLVLMVVRAGWLPGRPRRGVDLGSVVRFGNGLMASQLVGYVNSNVDTWTLALTQPAAALGLYNRGYQLLMRPLNQLRGPSTTVALPVLSRLRDDPDRAGRYLVRGQLAFGYTLIPGLAVAVGASTPVVALALGPAWASVAPVLAALGIAGALQTMSYVGNWVYLARALTGKLFWYSLVSLSIKVLCVLIGVQWGITGVAVGLAVASGLAWPISLWWLSRLTPIPAGRLTTGAVRVLVMATLAGWASYGTVLGVEHWAGSAIQLLLAVVAAVAVYAVAALLVPLVRRDLVDVLATAKKAVRR